LSLPDPEPSDLMTSEETEAFEAAMEADLQHSASTVTVLEKHAPSDRIDGANLTKRRNDLSAA